MLFKGTKSAEMTLPGKALALLCYLAVTGEPQTRETIAGLLWSDFPEQRAGETMSVIRSPVGPHTPGRLRRIWNAAPQLFPSMATHPSGSIAAKFQKGVARWVSGNWRLIPQLIRAASALYHGDFLPGFVISKAALFEGVGHHSTPTMHLRAIEGLQHLVDFHLEAGNYEAGIIHACRLLNLDP